MTASHFWTKHQCSTSVTSTRSMPKSISAHAYPRRNLEAPIMCSINFFCDQQTRTQKIVAKTARNSDTTTFSEQIESWAPSNEISCRNLHLSQAVFVFSSTLNTPFFEFQVMLTIIIPYLYKNYKLWLNIIKQKLD